MRAKGIVLNQEGSIARVKVCHDEFCFGCLHRCSKGEQGIEIAVQDPIGTKPGQEVEFQTDTAKMLLAVLLVFWLPLAGAGAGAFLGYWGGKTWGFGPTLAALLLGLLSFMLAVGVVWRIGKKTKAGTGLIITRIIEEKRHGFFV